MTTQRVNSGKLLEGQVKSVLERLDFIFWVNHKFVGGDLPPYGYTCPFYIEECSLFPKGLIIETQNQESRGGIYRVFPYRLQLTKLLEPPTIFVIDGAAYRKEGSAEAWGREWLVKNQSQGNVLGVFWMQEFSNHMRKLTAEETPPKLLAKV